MREEILLPHLPRTPCRRAVIRPLHSPAGIGLLMQQDLDPDSPDGVGQVCASLRHIRARLRWQERPASLRDGLWAPVWGNQLRLEAARVGAQARLRVGPGVRPDSRAGARTRARRTRCSSSRWFRAARATAMARSR